MAFGMPDKLMREIDAVAVVHGIDRVTLFGSRARGDFRETSDIDLAVTGGDIAGFAVDIEEDTDTLLKFDVVNLDGTVRDDLRRSIEREGRIIHEKVR